MKKLLTILLFVLFVSFNTSALEDETIYALSNGTYTYKDTNYELEAFPLEQVLNDKRGGEGPSVDSVVPVTVEIYPVENVDIDGLRTLVRPLALQFHRRGAKVNTRFMNSVIPYLFKKPEFFETQQQ